MKARALLLLMFCAVAAEQAHAGLFVDEETRKQLRELEGRISLLEDAGKQRTQALIDLQTQLQAMSDQVRKLQGQNEQLQHDLQDAEKRQKDFYLDLDTRLRRIEAGAQAGQAGQAGQPAASGAVVSPGATSPGTLVAGAAGGAPAPIDPVAENRDYDAAYSLYKANKQQASINAFMDFLKKYPGSTLAPNAYYWMGAAYYALKDYKNAVNSYLTLASKFPGNAKAPNALLGAAICYQEMGDVAAQKKTLQQILSNYPDSPIAPRAKKHLESLK